MDGRPERKRDLVVLAYLGATVSAVVAVTVFDVPIRTLLFYGMIAICPLMHLFMGHGSHGHGAGSPSPPGEAPVAPAPDEP